jgi:tRNA pseudouridine38-40 synthase
LRRGLQAREARVARRPAVTLFRLTLAYDGTDFEGWQSQARVRPVRTVQGVLEAALGNLVDGARVPVVAAGRTDAGVHALGQVVSFDLPRDLEPGLLARALNGLLPPDVRVLAGARAAPGFDARRTAASKLYRYVMDTGALQVPSRRLYAAHVRGPLDEKPMRSAAALYLGRHDFASVASAGGNVKTSVRTISRSELRIEPLSSEGGGPAVVYEVEADGFLRRMVRSLVGGLIAAGRGVVSVEDLRRALEVRDRGGWPAPAPARGLILVRVDYPSAGEPRE